MLKSVDTLKRDIFAIFYSAVEIEILPSKVHAQTTISLQKRNDTDICSEPVRIMQLP
jgi:hypothetical protein